MALSKPKKNFILYMGIFLLMITFILSLINNDFQISVKLIVSNLIGWLAGMGAMVLLIKYTRLGDGLEKSK